MLNNNQLGIGLMLLVIIFIFVMRRRENYGTFSHRGALRGIKNQVRNHYTLEELKLQYPTNYWNYKGTGPMSIYDRDVQSYHAKRFNPEMTM